MGVWLVVIVHWMKFKVFDIFEMVQDGWFTFSEMECMGSCVNAPMIAIADYREGLGSFSYNYYEDLTPAKAVQILDDLKAGKQPRARTFLHVFIII